MTKQHLKSVFNQTPCWHTFYHTVMWGCWVQIFKNSLSSNWSFDFLFNVCLLTHLLKMLVRSIENLRLLASKYPYQKRGVHSLNGQFCSTFFMFIKQKHAVYLKERSSNVIRLYLIKWVFEPFDFTGLNKVA